MHELRAAIAAADEETVFVCGVEDTLRGTPFLVVGLAQSQILPFCSHGKAVYPVVSRLGWVTLPPAAPLATRVAAMAPITSWLASRGEPFAVLWIDAEAGRVVQVPTERLAPLEKRLAELPRLEMIAPVRTDLGDVTDAELEFVVGPNDVLDIFYYCGAAQGRYVRRTSERYATGRRDADGVWHEHLRRYLEYASLLPGPNRGRCWFWVVATAPPDPGNAGAPIVRVSGFITMRSVVPNQRPRRDR